MKKQTSWLIILVASLATFGCGELPTVQSAFLIGITPHADFATSGKVDFAILPKDEQGAAIIDSGLDILLDVADPADVSLMQLDAREILPNPQAKLAATLDLDSSGSMSGNDPMRLRVKAAQEFIAQLGNDDQVAVCDFGAGKTAPFQKTRLLADFTKDKTAARAAADKVMASGSTPMFKSVVEVLDYFNSKHPAGSVNRALLVLGDGKPNGGGTLTQACDKAKQTGIRINTVGFGPAADQSPRRSESAVRTLRDLATCSGGAYTGVVDASELQNAFSNLGQAAKSGSVIITVQFGPIPAKGTPISGNISIGNGAQDPIQLQYSFTAP